MCGAYHWATSPLASSHPVLSSFAVIQEWPEEDYPPYANGPGYIVTSDIAHFIVSEFKKHKLRVPYETLSLSLGWFY